MISARKKIVIGTQVRQREKNVAVSRKTNAFRNDANNLSWDAIDVQLLSNHQWKRAETIAPKSFADECDFARAGHIVVLNEIATESRPDLQDRQIVGCNAGRAESLRLRAGIRAGNIHALPPNECKIDEAPLRRAPVEIIHVADRA